MALGLLSAAKVKRFATKVIDTNSERQIDEALWRKNVLDLHQVMFVARNLYLTLESNNEATLRVAVEIVTCIKHRRVIFWDDMWHSEDQKRDHFKEMVADKLRQVIQGVRGADGAGAAGGKGGDQAGKGDDVEKMKAKIKELETAKEAGVKQQRLAEMVARQAEERAAQAEEALAAARKSQGQRGRGGGEDPSKVRELEEKLAASEAAQQELKKQMQALMRDQAAAGDSAAAGTTRLQEELGAARSRIAELEKELADALSRPTEALIEVKSEALPEIDMAAATKPLAQKLAAEKLRYEKELEALRAKARADATAALAGAEEAEALTAGLRAQLEEAQSRADDAEAKLQDALQRLEEARSAQLLSGACGDEAAEALRRASLAAAAEVKALQQELRAKTAETDQARAKLEKKSKQLAEKMEEIESMEVERQKMLRTIHTLKEQLERLKEIAEKKGYGNLVDELMEEAGMKETMASAEFNCFARLYQDALRRMQKVNSLEQRHTLTRAPALLPSPSEQMLQKFAPASPSEQMFVRGGSLLYTDASAAPFVVLDSPGEVRASSSHKQLQSLRGRSKGLDQRVMSPASPAVGGMMRRGAPRRHVVDLWDDSAQGLSLGSSPAGPFVRAYSVEHHSSMEMERVPSVGSLGSPLARTAPARLSDAARPHSLEKRPHSRQVRGGPRPEDAAHEGPWDLPSVGLSPFVADDRPSTVPRGAPRTSGPGRPNTASDVALLGCALGSSQRAASAAALPAGQSPPAGAGTAHGRLPAASPTRPHAQSDLLPHSPQSDLLGQRTLSKDVGAAAEFGRVGRMRGTKLTGASPQGRKTLKEYSR